MRSGLTSLAATSSAYVEAGGSAVTTTLSTASNVTCRAGGGAGWVGKAARRVHVCGFASGVCVRAHVCVRMCALQGAAQTDQRARRCCSYAFRAATTATTTARLAHPPRAPSHQGCWQRGQLRLVQVVHLLVPGKQPGGLDAVVLAQLPRACGRQRRQRRPCLGGTAAPDGVQVRDEVGVALPEYLRAGGRVGVGLGDAAVRYRVWGFGVSGFRSATKPAVVFLQEHLHGPRGGGSGSGGDGGGAACGVLAHIICLQWPRSTARRGCSMLEMWWCVWEVACTCAGREALQYDSGDAW